MPAFIYKGKAFSEPGNVQFGSDDISKIGDGTITGAVVYLNSLIKIEEVDQIPDNPKDDVLYVIREE